MEIIRINYNSSIDPALVGEIFSQSFLLHYGTLPSPHSIRSHERSLELLA